MNKINNIDSFSDEQLLSIVNRTILDKTTYSLDKFSGGYVAVTTAYQKKITKYKVCLFFGYKKDGKTSISSVFEIDKELYFIWSKSIMIKTLSLKINNIGSTINDINNLIKPLSNKEEEEIKNRSEKIDRTDTERNTEYNLPPTSTSNTLLPREDIKNFIDLKKFILKNCRDKKGNHIRFSYNNILVSISDKHVPYYRNKGSSPALSFSESDQFYKYLFKNLDETLILISAGQEE